MTTITMNRSAALALWMRTRNAIGTRSARGPLIAKGKEAKTFISAVEAVRAAYLATDAGHVGIELTDAQRDALAHQLAHRSAHEGTMGWGDHAYAVLFSAANDCDVAPEPTVAPAMPMDHITAMLAADGVVADCHVSDTMSSLKCSKRMPERGEFHHGDASVIVNEPERGSTANRTKMADSAQRYADAGFTVEVIRYACGCLNNVLMDTRANPDHTVRTETYNHACNDYCENCHYGYGHGCRCGSASPRPQCPTLGR